MALEEGTGRKRGPDRADTELFLPSTCLHGIATHWSATLGLVALRDAVTRHGTGVELSGSSASLPSPPFAVFSFLAGPELCDPGSSGAIAVWDKQ